MKKNESLTLVRYVSLEKDGVLACWPAASNSPAMAGSVSFFSCETCLHLIARDCINPAHIGVCL